MRKYQPIWEGIKSSKDKTLRIAAPAKLHQRIIKAVRKEKCNDIRFKFDLAELRKRATLDAESRDSVLTFRLTFSIGIEDI